MRLSLRALACATLGAGVAFGAQAQSTPATPSSQPGAVAPAPSGLSVDPRRKATPDPHPQAPAGLFTGDPIAVADAEYKAAQKACDAKSGGGKDGCLKEAKAAYDRARGKDATSEPAPPAPVKAAPDTKPK